MTKETSERYALYKGEERLTAPDKSKGAVWAYLLQAAGLKAGLFLDATTIAFSDDASCCFLILEPGYSIRKVTSDGTE